MTFFERLKEERKRLRMSQTRLAEIAGTTKNSQLNYEKGNVCPSSSYLEAIASAGVDVQYVLTGQRSKEPVLTPEEKALLLLWRNATGPGKAAALAALQAGGEKNRRHLVQGAIHTEAGGQTVIAGGDIKGNFSV